MTGGNLNETLKDCESRLEKLVGTLSTYSLLSLSTQMKRSEVLMVEMRNSFVALQNDTEEQLCIVMEDILAIVVSLKIDL